MKQLLKQSAFMMLVISFVTLFIGCEKGPDFKIVTYPAPEPTDFNAKSGYPGSDVTITGKNFGTLAKAVTILFNGIPSDSIRSIEDGKIIVKTPANGTTGKITLKVWTNTVVLNGVFTFLPAPTIKSVTSKGPLGTGIAAKGDEVVIKGTGFGIDPSKVSVSFNGTLATLIKSLADTSILVVTPDGYSSGNIVVRVNGFPITGKPLLNPDVKGDISVFYLKNYKQTFISTTASGTGRWRIPTDWTITSPILNHGGYGGWGSDDGTVLAVESGWGAPAVVNGKMYQTITLPAGNYTFTAVLYKNGFNNPVYIAAAAGNTLPDATAVPTSSLGYFSMVSTHLDAGASDTFPSFSFTLTQTTQVSLGFVISNMTTTGEFWRVKSVKLVSN